MSYLFISQKMQWVQQAKIVFLKNVTCNNQTKEDFDENEEEDEDDGNTGCEELK